MNNKYATRWHEAKPPPAGMKKKSRHLLRKMLLLVYSRVQRKEDDKYLRCLYLHYVFDDQRKEFDNLLKRLKEKGEFVDTSTCLDMIEGRREIDRRYFHLSFDDGFRNQFTNAVPILKKHGIPAIFFVPSALVDAGYEEARDYCINTTKYNAVIEMIRWNDLKDMLEMGFEIGSHSRTHARFSEIASNNKLLMSEVKGSKKDLEDKLNYECRYISWPYGSLSDVDDSSLEYVKEAGYSACFGAYRGTPVPGGTDIFSIPRHQFEVQWPVSHIMYFVRGNMERRATKKS